MKKAILFGVLLMLLGLFALPLQAQTYENLWKEVENFSQKDLPKSAVKALDKIYEKASREGNNPQKIKAYLERMDYRTKISPDSIDSEMDELRRWAAEERDTVARAVLNSVVGEHLLRLATEKIDSVIYYFRLSLRDEQVLGRVSAKNYAPLAISRQLSEKYFGDNMFDLLVRHAVRNLQNSLPLAPAAVSSETVLEFYRQLENYYAAKGNRSAELLVRLAELEYRNGYSVSPALKLSHEEFVKRLRGWMKEYSDVEACAAAYVCLEERYEMRGENARAMEVIEEGLERYPESEFAADLKDRKRLILTPSFSLKVGELYPGEETEIEFVSRNLKGVSLELYRLNLKPSSPVFAAGERKYETLIKKYGTRCDKRYFALPATPEYTDSTTKATYRLPEAGIYLLKAVPDGFPDKVSYDIFHLSSLQVLNFPLFGEVEYYVVDRRSGHPVPGAEIVFYSVPVPGSYTVYRTFRTDSEGKVRVKKMPLDMLWMNARTEKEDFMGVTYANRGELSFHAEDKEMYRADLFTDRSLYRPGQTVFVSGVFYKQAGDEVKVRAGYETEVVLRDANSRELAKKKITTDDFGGFSLQFTLPQGVLPGNFRLSTEGGARFIRVEEYKRPTFDVVFTPYEHTYAMGDTLQLEGTAKNFSGVPVRGARVAYTVTRSKQWFWRPGEGKEIVGSGTATTDTEGTFHVKACLVKPEAEDEYFGQGFYRYEVLAEVTGEVGETRSGTLTLSVGEQSVGLQVNGLREKVMREKRDSICFLARNLSNRPVDVKVDYAIYPLDNEQRKGEKVAVGSASSGKFFIPETLLGLASGKYRMEYSALDEQGRVCKAEQDFVLFSAADVRPPYETVQWFYRDGTDFSAPVTLYVGSSEEDVCVFYNVYAANRRIHTEKFLLNNETRKFVFDYKPEYGDGVTISFAFMREGTLYTKEVSLKRPEPRKELTLKWETFRDKLTPGSEEEWKLTVSHADGKPADARLIATLYDASLDRLLENRWNFNLSFQRFAPSVHPSLLNVNNFMYLYAPFYRHRISSVYRFGNFWEYSSLDIPFLRVLRGNQKHYSVRGLSASRALYAGVEAKVADVNLDGGFEENSSIFSVVECSFEEEKVEAYVPLRENFSETAFFYPDLRTDPAGNVHLVFKMPDALTEWRFMGFAHTHEMDYGMLTAKVKTVKSLMIQPNMPRFVRRGDRTVLSVSVNNLSVEAITGKTRIELLDPLTNQTVYSAEQPFTVSANGSETVGFSFDADVSQDVLVCKIVAESDLFSDGEQHYLPILSDKQWVTETVPVQMNDETVQRVQTENLFNNQSETAANRRLTVELTATPDWYIVQALPVLGNPQTDDAFAWAAAYYANVISLNIVNANPKLKQTFDTWKMQGKTKETLLSSLEKNEDLKTILLEETPWVAEAENETEQKRRIALLFDINTMNSQLMQVVSKLESLQKPDGGWSWYKGMGSSRIVTTQIVEMFARMKMLAFSHSAKAEKLYNRAAEYLTVLLKQEVESMKYREAEGEKRVLPGEDAVRYLYIGAIDKDFPAPAEEVSYLIEKLQNRSSEYTIKEKALIAVIMQEYGKKQEASDLLRSIREYSVFKLGMGRYFDTPKAHYSWNDFKISTQTAVMEAVNRIDFNEQEQDEMRFWLLKQKQVQVWDTPIATVDAVFAFLLTDRFRIVKTSKVTAEAGNVKVSTPDDAIGYTRRTLTEDETRVPEVRFEKQGEGQSWGAVYAQYFEETDKISASKGNGLKIAREYFKGDRKVTSKTPLKVGDKLTVRLKIKADRDMEFIQVKDERAACMELTEQLSGYEVRNGLAYYRVNRDTATSFFINRLRKGTYTITYDVYIDRSGVYRSGIGTIQSAYAPEFGGYTSGALLTVE